MTRNVGIYIQRLISCLFPVRDDSRWVDSGNIVTSAGISAGLDMNLHLVARLETRNWRDEPRGR